MKVKIGPYKNWWGPYQIARLLRYIGVPEDTYEAIGDWLADTWVHELCLYIHRKRTKNGEQSISIQVDRWDTYSAYSTLAEVIYHTLKQFDEDKIGSPMPDDEDVPEHLGIRSTDCTVEENKEHGGTDCHVHDRWDWIVGEMVWTFDQLRGDWEEQFYEINPVEDRIEERTKHVERINNGLRLFAKYYWNLWW